MEQTRYVIVTAAYNEEKFIQRTIECVLAQTHLPERWVIVSDGSRDGTDQLISGYARRHSFIRYCRIEDDHPRDLARRIRALNVGFAELAGADYDFVCSLDADVSFPPEYFEELCRRFLEHPRLGLAAGVLHEVNGTNLKPVTGERFRAVANAAQLFRRTCFEGIGGYPPLPYGGPDTYAEVAARMQGWRVGTFTDLIVDHHRSTASGSGLLRGRLRQGYKDYSFGYHPLFELFKCTRRLREKPVIVGGILRMAGYAWSWLRGDRVAVPRDFTEFLRKEQLQRLLEFFGLKRPNAFTPGDLDVF